MSILSDLKKELRKYSDQQKKKKLTKYFQVYQGGYGEGDKFLGVNVPSQRRIVSKYYKNISLKQIARLLKSPVHEHRFTGLLLLGKKFKKAKKEQEQKKIIAIYLNNLDGVNNWDLVDYSADKILGEYLVGRDPKMLYEFAESGDLWKQRIAIVATFAFIKKNQFDLTFEISRLLLDHEHELIHKAVGWMLKETGKRDFSAEFNFLKECYRKMPRSMLRYAIEKFDKKTREKFLKGKI